MCGPAREPACVCGSVSLFDNPIPLSSALTGRTKRRRQLRRQQRWQKESLRSRRPRGHLPGQCSSEFTPLPLFSQGPLPFSFPTLLSFSFFVLTFLPAASIRMSMSRKEPEVDRLTIDHKAKDSARRNVSANHKYFLCQLDSFCHTSLTQQLLSLSLMLPSAVQGASCRSCPGPRSKGPALDQHLCAQVAQHPDHGHLLGSCRLPLRDGTEYGAHAHHEPAAGSVEAGAAAAARDGGRG
jgi:hypothetical protein